MQRVIDVSYYNGKVNWELVKAAGYHAILRAGYGTDRTDQDDTEFKRNADACERLGIPWGAYLYSYADNTTRAMSEAAHMIRLLEPYKDARYRLYPCFSTPSRRARRMRLPATPLSGAGNSRQRATIRAYTPTSIGGAPSSNTCARGVGGSPSGRAARRRSPGISGSAPTGPTCRGARATGGAPISASRNSISRRRLFTTGRRGPEI